MAAGYRFGFRLLEKFAWFRVFPGSEEPLPSLFLWMYKVLGIRVWGFRVWGLGFRD